MPYTKAEERQSLNALIDALSEQIHIMVESDWDDIGAHLNYSISRLLRNALCENFKADYSASHVMTIRYKRLERLVGMLDACKTEFSRRVVGPYEDEKMSANGDVY